MNRFFCVTLLMFLARTGFAQTESGADSVLRRGTLANCIRFALTHQPVIRQSRIDEEITEHSINARLSDWYPHVGFTATVQHDPQLPVSGVQGTIARVGLPNTSSGQFLASQTLFDRDVLLASSTAGDVREQSKERTVSSAIDIVVGVSKAFYAVLLAQDQTSVFNDDVVRLEQNLKDAYNQYHAGIVDKTDFERATVSLNNARVAWRQSRESLTARIAFLKEAMGYPSAAPLTLEHDSTQMADEVFIDTTQQVRYEGRIEYQLLQTQKRLDEANLHYYQWDFLPSLSAFAGYALNYLGGTWSQVYLRNYPSSFVGLQLSYPIFEGGRRIQEIDQASLELDRAEEDIISLENQIDAQYAQAMADYKSDLNSYLTAEQNLALAKDVYRTIQLQYRAGTKSYLEVISAETDLRTAEITQATALYQVLSSKLDVQKALGTVPYSLTRTSNQ